MTDDPERAIERVHEALEEAPPGTGATVHRVALASSLRGVYEPVTQVGRARRDEATDAIVWEV